MVLGTFESVQDKYEPIIEKYKIPEEAVAVFKSWFEENKNNPYPNRKEKLDLSAATGIDKKKWFSYHRRKTKKLEERLRPVVTIMDSLKTRDEQAKDSEGK
eukprot:IDg7952t1